MKQLSGILRAIRLPAIFISAAIALMACDWVMPTDVQVKGSPNYQLPAGVMNLQLSDVLDFDSFLGQNIEESFTFDIDQGDAVSNLSVPGASFNLSEPGSDGSMTIANGGDFPPATVSLNGGYSELEFESGMLEAPMQFDTLSAGVTVEIDSIQIVDPNDGYSVIAESVSTSYAVTGDGSTILTADVEFDLAN
ncbi:MAG: hypothetical protein ACOC0D_07575, partial [Spirochaeta sp.]